MTTGIHGSFSFRSVRACLQSTAAQVCQLLFSRVGHRRGRLSVTRHGTRQVDPLSASFERCRRAVTPQQVESRKAMYILELTVDPRSATDQDAAKRRLKYLLKRADLQ
jgi:hypothetical protein